MKYEQMPAVCPQCGKTVRKGIAKEIKWECNGVEDGSLCNYRVSHALYALHRSLVDYAEGMGGLKDWLGGFQQPTLAQLDFLFFIRYDSSEATIAWEALEGFMSNDCTA